MFTKQNEAKASYVGIGRKQVIEQTFWQIPSWRLTDPLAQTFILTEERYITAVDLFLATKDPAADLTVQLRTVVNGYPSMTVLTSVALNPDQVNISNNGTTATKVTFPDPVLLQANTEYAIVLLTPSSQYRAFVARMGAKDLITQKPVARQPYDVGLLFSSSNGSAWTAHQDMDLKFRLYGAKFTSDGILRFRPMEVSQATQLVLASSQLVPQKAELQWQYSTDEMSWYALDEIDVTKLGQPTDMIHVRALLKSKGSSPVVQQNVGAIALGYKPEGMYVSREITTSAPFTRITVYVELSTPSGTSQTVEYSLDAGKTWTSMGSAVAQTPIDADFTQLKFEKTVASSTKLRVRIKQSSTVPVVTPKARNLMVHTS
ncbi:MULTISPECIES: choice-of-anchor R domain-containing protein [Brevibacillus]|jgi:hypothetical protein|uniref:choice-of-anchor R domain-containing protein n=1 Tax=Brevibacillus TaxID=55080 RepID=UPI001FA96A91|nr:choice-of-anchor R domain-containing protein [Brevibacillus borstelensis]MED1745726.1 choice-of-anchor R domain-containing protein [Brevibacillus borstelensis]MED2008678.1 choice-of-anchor R domain-containing protein [Brevibacillus borstelensis]